MNRLRTGPLAAALVTPLLVTSFAAAQAVRGGDILVSDPGTATIHVVTAAGSISTLPTGGLVSDPRGVATDRDGSVLVCDYTSDSLIRIDASGSASVVSSLLRRPMRVAVDHDGSYLVTNDATLSIDRVFPGGGVASFLPQNSSAIQRPYDVLVDGDGTYVVCDDLGGGLYRVSQRGSVTPIHTGAPFSAPRGVSQFPNGDYAVLDANGTTIHRVDRLTSAVTTWIPPVAFLGTLSGICEVHNGGFYVVETGAQQLLGRIEPWQIVTPLGPVPAFSQIDDVAVVPTLTAPVSFTTGPGSAAIFGIDVPSLPGRPYTIGLSGSVHPGLLLPAGDPRGIALNADSLLLATLFANAPPVLVQWTGVTAANGHASPMLDLSLLPPGIFAGAKFHAQGLVFDATAPNGVALITNPVPMPFR